MTTGPDERDKDTIHLLHLTDPHLFSDERGALAGISTASTWRSVLEEVRGREALPDAVLVTGDLTHDQQVLTYRRLMADLQAFTVPVFVLPGNHDDVDVMGSVFPPEGPVCWAPHARLGGWLMVMLDSTLPGSPGGRLNEGELDRLERTLREHPGQPTLVALHHQPVPVGSDWLDAIGVDNGAALMTLLGAHPQVRVVLWGHVHQGFDATRGSMRLLATPSTCIQFRPEQRHFTLDDAAPGWRHLTLRGGGDVETRVERLERLPAGLDLDLAGY